MLQQLVAESRFFTSSRVNLVRALTAVGEADLVGVGLGEAIGDLLGVTLELFLGFGVAFTTLPLFQTSFPLFLTQKCFNPPLVLVVPTLLHLVPAIDAACEGKAIPERNTAARRTLE